MVREITAYKSPWEFRPCSQSFIEGYETETRAEIASCWHNFILSSLYFNASLYAFKILPRPANSYLNKLIYQPTSLGYSVAKAQPFRAANASDRLYPGDCLRRVYALHLSLGSINHRVSALAAACTISMPAYCCYDDAIWRVPLNLLNGILGYHNELPWANYGDNDIHYLYYKQF